MGIHEPARHTSRGEGVGEVVVLRRRIMTREKKNQTPHVDVA